MTLASMKERAEEHGRAFLRPLLKHHSEKRSHHGPGCLKGTPGLVHQTVLSVRRVLGNRQVVSNSALSQEGHGKRVTMLVAAGMQSTVKPEPVHFFASSVKAGITKEF